MDYLEKSKNLQDQLRDLRTEIEVLKVSEKQSDLDTLHEEQVRLGETKYSTLRRVSLHYTLIVHHILGMRKFQTSTRGFSYEQSNCNAG